MNRATFLARRWWWKRFHPLVRIGWLTATAGARRPVTQTAIGLGLMGAGVMLRRSKANKPIYTHVVDQGQTIRLRVFHGDGVPSEAIVRN